VFWNYNGDGPASDEQKRAVSEKFFQRYMRTLLEKARLPDATSHKFRHTLAIEIDVSLLQEEPREGNTVAGCRVNLWEMDACVGGRFFAASRDLQQSPGLFYVVIPARLKGVYETLLV
jgi:hypothetical protein